ncbi:MAG TPA: FAD binding domain-containing protein, partial [Gemmatimonadaceae bacterium]
MYDFVYQRAGSADEAVRMLTGDPEAKPLAGGQTLIPVLKQRLNHPSKVIDLSKAGLSGIKVDAGTVTIGAMTTHAAVANSAEVAK